MADQLFLKPCQPKPDCGQCQPNKPCYNHENWRPPEDVKILDPKDFAHLEPPKSTETDGCAMCGQDTGDEYHDLCLACWKTQNPSRHARSGKQLQYDELRSAFKKGES